MKKLAIISLVFISLISLAFADSNGIWHEAADIKGGTFGSDESPTSYTFNVPVYFNSIYPSIFYDGEDSSYYLNPFGVSNLLTLNLTTLNANSVSSASISVGGQDINTKFVDVAGDTMSGDLNLGNNDIINTNEITTTTINADVIKAKSGGSVIIQLS